MDTAPTPTEFATKAGISVPYASELLSGKRTPSTRLAIDIYRRTGRKFGRIAALSDADIDTLDRLTPQRRDRAAA
jgi:transcriptional regulator with XRE-family HTH domain